MSQKIVKTQAFTANSQNMDFDTVDIGSLAFSVQGTFSVTLSFFVSDDAGVTYYPFNMTPANSTTPVLTATALGLFKADVTPYSKFRVQSSSYVSGTANGRITGSPLQD